MLMDTANDALNSQHLAAAIRYGYQVQAVNGIISPISNPGLLYF